MTHAIAPRKNGLLLVNLGTPTAPTAPAVRAFLKVFLSDRRVIELTPWLWQIILRCFILPFRPGKVAQKYQKIWRNDGLSPLEFYTQSLSHKLQGKLGDDWAVAHAYSYSQPLIAEQCAHLFKMGCRSITIVPLYPQYSATTTASVVDAVGRYLAGVRHQPNITIVPPYYDHPSYIRAIGDSIKPYLSKVDKIIVSYHGLPRDNVKNGDPYSCHCAKTTRLLGEYLQTDKLVRAYQSRFGPKEWLQPYCSEVIGAHGKNGQSLAVIAPGFASDCLETLEEINMELRHIFEQQTQAAFHYIPCLNDDDSHVQLILDLINQGGNHEKTT